MDGASNVALLTALQQAGVKLKAALFSVGYEPSVVHSTAWSSLQGSYFLSLARPLSLPNAGTEAMAAALKKYAGFTKSQFPEFGQDLSWLSCDLMIEGLKRAGQNPTRAGVIKALRSIKSYNGNGLLPVTIDYSTVFGHDLPQCAWVLRAEKSGFVPVSSKPLCGTDYPGTSLGQVRRGVGPSRSGWARRRQRPLGLAGAVHPARPLRVTRLGRTLHNGSARAESRAERRSGSLRRRSSQGP